MPHRDAMTTCSQRSLKIQKRKRRPLASRQTQPNESAHRTSLFTKSACRRKYFFDCVRSRRSVGNGLGGNTSRTIEQPLVALLLCYGSGLRDRDAAADRSVFSSTACGVSK